MAEPKESILETNMMPIAIKRWGTPGGRKVLGLHGWLDNLASFDPLGPYMESYDFVAIDFPGHGLSGHLSTGSAYHFLDSVYFVLMVTDALGWDSFDVLGHSMGAGVGYLMAAAVPERVSSAFFIEGLGPLSDPEDAPVERFRHHVSQRSKFGKKRAPVYQSIEEGARARMAVATIDLESAMTIAERGLEKRADGYVWRADARLRVRSAYYFSEPQVRAFGAAISCPVHLVRAEPGMSLARMGMQGRIDKIANIAVTEIEGHHHVHMQKPAAVAEAMHKFWP